MTPDRLIVGFDRLLRTITGSSPAKRAYPACADDAGFTDGDRRRAACLMRVDHAGEVCAQALYVGQAIVARNQALANSLFESADDEADHLAWTSRRLRELDDRSSFLGPVWYAGSLLVGVSVASLGDEWSLAFLRETELQVVEHLETHLSRLPETDKRSREVVAAMLEDEARHAATALQLGAVSMPPWAIAAMRFSSGMMTRTAYLI